MENTEALIQAQKLLQELEAKTFKVNKEVEEAENVENSPKIKFLNTKKMLTASKWKFIDLQSKLFLTDFLQSDNKEEWLKSRQNIAAELKDKSNDVRTCKDKSLEICAEIENSCQTTDEKFISLKNKIEELKIHVEDIKDVKKNVDLIETEVKEALTSFDGKERNIEKFLESQKQKLATTQKKILELSEENEKAEKKIQLLKESCSNLEMIMRHKEKHADKLKILKQKETADIEARIKWCQKVTKFVTNLGGVSEKELRKDSIVLEILNPKCKDEPVLLLTLYFTEGKYEERLLKKVEIDINDFDIDDIVEYGIKKNDVKFVIHQIKQRWLAFQPFYKEICETQKRFTVEWLVKERLLKVFVGTDRQTLCTLHIKTTYPSHGSIVLKQIQTREKNVSLPELKFLSEKVYLLDWIEILNNFFQ